MHDLEHRWARWLIAGGGLLASLMLLSASALMNWRFGCTLGRTPFDCQIYGWASACADVLLAASPFFFFAAVASREPVRALASFVVWAMCLCFAAISALGHAATNRLDSMSVREVAATTYADTRTELEEARKARGFIPDLKGRNEAGIRAEIERLKVDRRWVGSNECTEISGKSERSYCAEYQTLQSDLGNAREAAKLDARIAGLVTKSDTLGSGSTAVKSEGDPQAKIISLLSGLNLKTVQGALTALIAAMILCCAGFGPYVSMSVLSPRRRRYVVVPATAIITQPAEPQQLLIKRLPAPVLAPKMAYVPRPDPGPEGRALLASIGYPQKKLPEIRPKDERAHLALRFLTWLTVYGLKGDHTAEQIDDLYAEFATTDYREPWGIRIVKAELSEFTKWVKVAQSRAASTDATKRPSIWTITPPPIAKLRPLLVKKGVITEPKPPEDKKKGTVIPFGEAASEPPATPAPAAADNPPPPVKGRAELHRRGYRPDLDSMRALAREQKRAWQQRIWSRDRKQTNRMIRAINGTRPAA